MSTTQAAEEPCVGRRLRAVLSVQASVRGLRARRLLDEVHANEAVATSLSSEHSEASAAPAQAGTPTSGGDMLVHKEDWQQYLNYLQQQKEDLLQRIHALEHNLLCAASRKQREVRRRTKEMRSRLRVIDKDMEIVRQAGAAENSLAEAARARLEVKAWHMAEQPSSSWSRPCRSSTTFATRLVTAATASSATLGASASPAAVDSSGVAGLVADASGTGDHGEKLASFSEVLGYWIAFARTWSDVPAGLLTGTRPPPSPISLILSVGMTSCAAPGTMSDVVDRSEASVPYRVSLSRPGSGRPVATRDGSTDRVPHVKACVRVSQQPARIVQAYQRVEQQLAARQSNAMTQVRGDGVAQLSMSRPPSMDSSHTTDRPDGMARQQMLDEVPKVERNALRLTYMQAVMHGDERMQQHLALGLLLHAGETVHGNVRTARRCKRDLAKFVLHLNVAKKAIELASDDRRRDALVHYCSMLQYIVALQKSMLRLVWLALLRHGLSSALPKRYRRCEFAAVRIIQRVYRGHRARKFVDLLHALEYQQHELNAKLERRRAVLGHVQDAVWKVNAVGRLASSPRSASAILIQRVWRFYILRVKATKQADKYLEDTSTMEGVWRAGTEGARSSAQAKRIAVRDDEYCAAMSDARKADRQATRFAHGKQCHGSSKATRALQSDQKHVNVLQPALPGLAHLPAELIRNAIAPIIPRIQRKTLVLLRGYRTPPAAVRRVLQCISCLLGGPCDWESAHLELFDVSGLIARLSGYGSHASSLPPHSAFEEALALAVHPTFTLEQVRKNAPEAQALFQWCRAVLGAYEDALDRQRQWDAAAGSQLPSVLPAIEGAVPAVVHASSRPKPAEDALAASVNVHTQPAHTAASFASAPAWLHGGVPQWHDDSTPHWASSSKVNGNEARRPAATARELHPHPPTNPPPWHTARPQLRRGAAGGHSTRRTLPPKMRPLVSMATRPADQAHAEGPPDESQAALREPTARLLRITKKMRRAWVQTDEATRAVGEEQAAALQGMLDHYTQEGGTAAAAISMARRALVQPASSIPEREPFDRHQTLELRRGALLAAPMRGREAAATMASLWTSGNFLSTRAKEERAALSSWRAKSRAFSRASGLRRRLVLGISEEVEAIRRNQSSEEAEKQFRIQLWNLEDTMAVKIQLAWRRQSQARQRRRRRAAGLDFFFAIPPQALQVKERQRIIKNARLRLRREQGTVATADGMQSSVHHGQTNEAPTAATPQRLMWTEGLDLAAVSREVEATQDALLAQLRARVASVDEFAAAQQQSHTPSEII